MTMTDERLAELDAVMAKATVAFPITSRDTVDYAEITFGSSQTQAMSMEPETLLAINDVFAAVPDLRAHIDAQAATIARLRAEVERLNGRALVLEAHLTEAIERVEKGDLDDRMCCDGHMCGCQGSTNADQFLHFARAALTGAA